MKEASVFCADQKFNCKSSESKASKSDKLSEKREILLKIGAELFEEFEACNVGPRRGGAPPMG